MAVWETRDKTLSSFVQFQQLFQRVFEHAPEEGEVSKHLLTLSQGNRRAAEYALEFCTLAVGSGWNELALKAAFRRGLK